MRVKKLEIFGFKSFYNRTIINFEQGVTAIVGPNGSGKSNIVDSIRWVLGEKNPRDVRAPRLEDVIFNGTDKKAPLSMAEVHLTISNEKGLLPISYSEVTITRRVYRSGETECLINQSPCRLRDIQELLMGTGLGGGTYAIIEQGHIDMILSSKPDERRVVFEEASGIAKYLSKKKETLRRLTEVEEHLVRIADITGEVRRQVASLERQAAKARNYKVQWDQLKDLELHLTVDEMRTGQERRGQLEEQLSALHAERDSLEKQKQEYVESIEACNTAVSACQDNVQILRTKTVECSSQIQQHESQKSLKQRWISELSAQAEQLESETESLRLRLTKSDEQLARQSGGETELKSQLIDMEEQAQRHGTELPALDASLKTITDKMTASKAALFEAASNASSRRNELTEATANLQSIEAQLARLESESSQRSARKDESQQRLDSLTKEQEQSKAQLSDIQQSITTAAQSLNGAQSRRYALTAKLNQLREQVAQARAQATLNEDLWRRYEGFPETVKALMNQPVEGLIGPLIDLVQPVPGHEELVEAALGPLSEAMVVADRNALMRCRQILGEQQLGGARFLVLADCPQVSTPSEQPIIEGGVSAAVSQYVNAESAYQPLINWLFNDSWVVEDIERLMAHPSVINGRVVSPRGERWDRRSWRMLGSNEVVRHQFGRKQRWEEALAKRNELEEQFTQLESETAQAEQVYQDLSSRLETAKAEQSHVSPAVQKLSSQHQQLTDALALIEEEADLSEQETVDLKQRSEAVQSSLSGLTRSVDEAEKNDQALEKVLVDAAAVKEETEKQRQQILITKAQSEALLQSLKERLDASQVRISELKVDREHLNEQIDAKQTQKQDAVSRSSELAQQLQSHDQQCEQLKINQKQLELDTEAAATSLKQEQSKRDEVLPHLLKAEKKLSELMRSIQEQAQTLSESSSRRTRMVERLQELYHIDEATLAAESQTDVAALSDEARTQMQQQVQKLRSKLEGIGPVSLSSVEEYDDLKRRFEFLEQQQKDLIQARDDLKASIAQINRTARVQFRETFEKVKQEFQYYYTRLFSGGQADLILQDEEDVLESGIDIVARPPGKRLQNISLLSGGERALTAIALLFALFKVRPSPFCILDEIDAPLDETNVGRFTKVLEEFLVLSQFILITHNKKTISKADSLYGVTMEEAGISKILSAKLTQQPKTPQSAPVAA